MRSLKYLLAIVLLGAAPRLHAAPCMPDTLWEYTRPGFSCTLADEKWRFSDFRYQAFSSVAVPSALAILVTPFGGTQVAGLRFDIREPFNALAAGDGFSSINMAYNVLSTAGVVNAAQETVNAFQGPPDGRVQPTERICLNGFYEGLGFDCSSDDDLILAGLGIDTQGFARSVFLGIRSQWILRSGDELPGGARLDGVINRFRTIPEPPGVLLVIAGLLGVAVARVRRSG